MGGIAIATIKPPGRSTDHDVRRVSPPAPSSTTSHRWRNGSRPVGVAVVDALVGTEGTQERMVRVAGRGEHPGPGGVRQLHRKLADAPGRRVHEDGLASAQVREVEQRVPRRQRRKRDGGRVRQCQRTRGGCDESILDRDPLRVRARPGHVAHREHGVADGETPGVRSQALDDAGHVPAEDGRELQRGEGLVIPAPELPVGRVDPGAVHANEDVVGPEYRLRRRFQAKFLRVPVPVDRHCQHGIDLGFAATTRLPGAELRGVVATTVQKYERKSNIR